MTRSQLSRAPIRGVALAASVLLTAMFASRSVAQGPKGDPTAPPTGMKVVFVDIGQGDATIVIGPTGKVLLFDAGNNGTGNTILAELRKHGATRVDYLVPSHYHADHLGGADEVMRGISVIEVIDRGTRDQPSTQSYRDYVRTAGLRRKTARTGQVLDLGGGARARVLAYDGNVLGRAALNIRGSRQYENSASLVLRVDYGDFSMWLGGDLTGGGNGTFDVETSVSQVCGDVDVYEANHHGSATSTNANFVRNVRPEVTILSAGVRNPFGHPHNEVLNRLNTRNDSRLLLGTTAGSGSSGFTVGGTMTLTTDGWRYRIETALGSAIDLYTDEYRGSAPRVGDLVVSEVQRSPSLSLGEYLEIASRAGAPLNLAGTRIVGNSGSFTIPTPYRLLPGERLVVLAHGDRARNGSIPFGHSWPFRALSLGDSSDNVRILHGSTTLDALSYNSSLAGGRGVAAERVDLQAATNSSNFRASTNRYGSDFGSPTERNSVDGTQWSLLAGVEVLPASSPGGRALHLFNAGFSDTLQLDAAALSFGTSPGFLVGSVRVPLNPDVLFSLTLQLPEFFGFLPPNGMRAWRMPVPPGLTGQRAYLGHFLLDPFGPTPVPSVSNAASFLFP